MKLYIASNSICQDMVKKFVVQSFKNQKNDLMIEKSGSGMKQSSPCAVIKVAISGHLGTVNFCSDGNGIYKVKNIGDNDYWIYIAPGEKTIKMLAENVLPACISLGNLEAFSIYKLEVSAQEKQPEIINFSFDTFPPGTEKIIDGQSLGIRDNIKLKEGEHHLILKKEGYRTIEMNFFADQENTGLRGIVLEELEPVPVKIYSKPENAEIYFDGKHMGETNFGFFCLPGEHELQLKKEGYFDIRQFIGVDNDDELEIKFDLQASTASLKLDVFPDNAKVKVNGHIISDFYRQGLEPGIYHIEVSSPNYINETRTVEIRENEHKVCSIRLKPRTGKLQFTVKPFETEILLLNNGNKVMGWHGLKFLKDIPAGQYTLLCKATGYSDYEKKIIIKENQLINECVIMQIDDKVMNDMTLVRAGKFDMGNTLSASEGKADEIPVHTVILTHDFFISKVTVSKQLYNSVMPNTSGRKKIKNFFRRKYPAENISWFRAIEFCNRYSEIKGLTPCYSINGETNPPSWHVGNIRCDFQTNGYRLPTEAEWEYVARGGHLSVTDFKYSGSDLCEEIAVFSVLRPAKKSLKKPNELGVYDMSGNIQEWCWDNYGSYSNETAVNPAGPKDGHYKVVRGGSWKSTSAECRVARRDYSSPYYAHRNTGLRLVRTKY